METKKIDLIINQPTPSTIGEMWVRYELLKNELDNYKEGDLYFDLISLEINKINKSILMLENEIRDASNFEINEVPSSVYGYLSSFIFISGADKTLEEMALELELKEANRKIRRKSKLKKVIDNMAYLSKEKKKIRLLADMIEDLKKERVEKNAQLKEARESGLKLLAMKIEQDDFVILEQRKDVIMYELLTRQKRLIDKLK